MPSGLLCLLGEVGLPKELEYYFEPVSPRRVLGRLSGWVIGTDGENDFVVCDDSGEVWGLAAEEGLGDWFLNSDVWKFVACLTEYAAFLRVPRSNDVDPNKDDFVPMRQQFASLDHRIFDDPDYWWSAIFEQLEDGLL